MEEIICSCIQFCWFGAWAANTRKWKTSPMPFHSGEKGQVDGHMIGKSSLSVPVQAKGCRECMCVFSCLADKLKQCEEYYHIPSGVWFSSLQTPFFLKQSKSWWTPSTMLSLRRSCWNNRTILISCCFFKEWYDDIFAEVLSARDQLSSHFLQE